MTIVPFRDWWIPRFRPLSGSYISQYKLKRRNVKGLAHRFRPLSGSYISQCVYNPYSNYDDGFRPLSGSYISQYNTESLWRVLEEFPSPIGELHFSITIYGFGVFHHMFPSPIGELHFSIPDNHLLVIMKSFPSPIGELHFSMRKEISFVNLLFVSVPYRGATFLNQ